MEVVIFDTIWPVYSYSKPDTYSGIYLEDHVKKKSFPELKKYRIRRGFNLVFTCRTEIFKMTDCKYSKK